MVQPGHVLEPKKDAESGYRDKLTPCPDRPFMKTMKQHEISERRQKVATLIARGFSCNEIAQKLAISRTTIKDDAQSLNLRFLVSSPPKNMGNRSFRIIAMLQASKMTYQAIADELGCTRQFIEYVRRLGAEAGIKFPIPVGKKKKRHHGG